MPSYPTHIDIREVADDVHRTLCIAVLTQVEASLTAHGLMPAGIVFADPPLESDQLSAPPHLLDLPLPSTDPYYGHHAGGGSGTGAEPAGPPSVRLESALGTQQQTPSTAIAGSAPAAAAAITTLPPSSSGGRNQQQPHHQQRSGGGASTDFVTAPAAVAAAMSPFVLPPPSAVVDVTATGRGGADWHARRPPALVPTTTSSARPRIHYPSASYDPSLATPSSSQPTSPQVAPSSTTTASTTMAGDALGGHSHPSAGQHSSARPSFEGANERSNSMVAAGDPPTSSISVTAVVGGASALPEALRSTDGTTSHMVAASPPAAAVNERRTGQQHLHDDDDDPDNGMLHHHPNHVAAAAPTFSPASRVVTTTAMHATGVALTPSAANVTPTTRAAHDTNEPAAADSPRGLAAATTVAPTVGHHHHLHHATPLGGVNGVVGGDDALEHMGVIATPSPMTSHHWGIAGWCCGAREEDPAADPAATRSVWVRYRALQILATLQFLVAGALVIANTVIDRPAARQPRRGVSKTYNDFLLAVVMAQSLAALAQVHCRVELDSWLTLLFSVYSMLFIGWFFVSGLVTSAIGVELERSVPVAVMLGSMSAVWMLRMTLPDVSGRKTVMQVRLLRPDVWAQRSAAGAGAGGAGRSYMNYGSPAIRRMMAHRADDATPAAMRHHHHHEPTGVALWATPEYAVWPVQGVIVSTTENTNAPHHVVDRIDEAPSDAEGAPRQHHQDDEDPARRRERGPSHVAHSAFADE